MNPQVDEFINNIQKWKEEITLLRSFLLDSELKEELKWKQPCYTYNNSNVVLIANFKAYCALAFFKGTLLKHNRNKLVSPGADSQAVLQLRFKSIDEIIKEEATIRSVIKEAVEIEKSGQKVKFTAKRSLQYPEELFDAFKSDHAFKVAFDALTPGRKRGYNLYFSSAKQSSTRASRIAENTSKILMGKDIHDCTCGLSKRLPRCDGSHKLLSNS